MTRLLSLIPLITFALSHVSAQNLISKEDHTSPDGKYKYYTVSNDPLKVRVYTLSNGLTVMMSVNKKQPRIQTYIAVRAGSKNDPADNTGLAHYLEHMLFKGTDVYGTKNWQSEKAQLDKIDALYEVYNKLKDENARKQIYHQIDSVSGVASRFAIANEYDKLTQTIGAQGTNAFTSLEQTVYVNDIPQNQLEKWIEIEAERFRNPVLRLFHTELEAVYEEKNISMDRDGNKVFEAMLAKLFRNHPYGTQTTIGTVEHLKNPSLIKIREYYKKYYVPNNMGIIMAGDFDPDATIKLIDSKFSYMQAKPIPQFTFTPERARTEPEVVNVYGPDAENLMIGFRFPQAGSREAKLLTVVDMLLANTKAGLIDLNLVKKQSVLSAGSAGWINKDYSLLFLMGKPKEGQTLEQVKDLLMSQVEKIKKGEFDEAALKSIISNMKVEKIRTQTNNEGRADVMLEAFVLWREWDAVVSDIAEMSKFTKQEIVDFAKKYFTNDYVVVYKRTGEDNSIKKIEKPQITAVDLNRDDVSPFVKKIVESPSPEIKPVFLDFEKDIKKSSVGEAPFYYVKNGDNSLFKLYYVLDMGKFNDLKLPVAVNLLQFLGTDKYSAEEISKEFYKLACDFGVNASNEQVYVYLSGLDENFGKALRLFEHLLANAKPDQQALSKFVERTLKARTDAKLNKNTIFFAAMQNYAMYGRKNPFTYNLSETELKSLKADDLVKYIRNLTKHRHKIYYFGPKEFEAAKDSTTRIHQIPAKLNSYPAAVVFNKKETNENLVYFVNYKMVQAEVMWLNKSNGKYDPARAPVIAMFNEYFGGGMSSLVFQTIRESKALAYSTWSRYNTPLKKEDPYYVMAYIGTQADKLGEAVPAMDELLYKMPEAMNLFNGAKASLKANLASERINDEIILFTYDAAQKLGVDHDIRKDIYESLDKMTYADVKKFYQENYVGKPFVHCVMGSSERINKSDLAKYGKVTEVSLEEIFGY